MDFKVANLKPGFTLLEVLVYIAVFSIIVTGVATISVAIFRNKTVVEDRVNVNEDVRLLNKLIRDDVYLGYDITVNSDTSFTVSIAGADDVTYFLSDNRVYRQAGVSSPVVITSASTDVQSFEVQDLSSPNAAETIRVYMALSNFDNGTLRPEIIEDVSTTFSIKFL